jgi:GNAT superfamily N-acetyltransferase
MRLAIEILTAAHDVAVCVTGDAAIDEYLHRLALAEQVRGLAAVHVATSEALRVVGFFTLSPLSLRVDENLERVLASTGFPYRQLGGYLLGRMGVGQDYQGKGVGAALAVEAIGMAREQQTTTGGVFLAVDPNTEKLAASYRRLGFAPLEPNRRRLRMILPLR